MRWDCSSTKVDVGLQRGMEPDTDASAGRVRTDREERTGDTGTECASSQINQMRLQYFGPTLVDDMVRSLLAPYVAIKGA